MEGLFCNRMAIGSRVPLEGLVVHAIDSASTTAHRLRLAHVTFCRYPAMQLQSGWTRLMTEAVALPAGLPVGKKAEKVFKIGCTLWTLQKRHRRPLFNVDVKGDGHLKLPVGSLRDRWNVFKL
jgi:hypothetical protein